jgi:hypothetical protein
MENNKGLLEALRMEKEPLARNLRFLKWLVENANVENANMDAVWNGCVAADLSLDDQQKPVKQ